MSDQSRENISCVFSGLKYNSKKFYELLEEKADLIFACHKLDGSDNELSEFILTLKEASMKILYIQKNKINFLQLNIPTIIELNISNNKLYEFPDLNCLINLELLFLSKNNIENLDIKKFYKLSELKIFEINNNQIHFFSVKEFKSCIENIAKNHKKIFSIVLDNNPFCHDEVFTQYYAYYISAIFCSKPNNTLKEINKIKINESENVNNIYAVLMDREKKKNEKNERIFNKIDTILEQFMLHENYIKEKLSLFKQLIIDFIKTEALNKTDFNIKFIEIETEDEDTISFEKFTSKLYIFIERSDELDNFFIKSFLNFSTIRKGKWAYIALSFIFHLVENRNKHKELDELLLKHFEKFLVDDNTSIVKNSNTMNNLEEEEANQKISIVSNPILLKGFKNFISFQYENFIKNAYYTIMETILIEPQEAIKECRKKYDEIFGKKKKKDQNKQYLLEHFFSDLSEKSLTRFYSLEAITLCFTSANYESIKKKINKEHITNLCIFTLLFWNNYNERNFLQKNLNLNFMKIVVHFTKIFRFILKNSIKHNPSSNNNKNLNNNKKGINKKDFDGKDNSEFLLDQKFVIELFTTVKNILKDNKVEHGHINPSSPSEWIFFISELSKQRNYVITNSISENDCKSLEMNALDNIFIAQMIKIATFLIFMFKDKFLFKRIIEKMNLFLNVKDEDVEKKKLEDKLKEGEKGRQKNSINNMIQNNLDKDFEFNRIIDKSLDDDSEKSLKNVTHSKFNNKNYFENNESPYILLENPIIENFENYIDKIKKKFNDNASNYEKLKSIDKNIQIEKNLSQTNQLNKQDNYVENSMLETNSQKYNFQDHKSKETIIKNEIDYEINPLQDYLCDIDDIVGDDKHKIQNIFDLKNLINIDGGEYKMPLKMYDFESRKDVFNDNNQIDNISILKDNNLPIQYLQTENEHQEDFNLYKYNKNIEFKLSFNDIIKYDPIFFQTAAFIFLKIFNEYSVMMNNDLFLNFLEENKKKVSFFLKVLNTEKFVYRYFCMMGFVYENFSVSPESSCFQEVNSLSNKYIIKLLNSILRIIQKIIKYETNDELLQKKLYSINLDLNELDRDNIMIKFLSSNVQKIKSNVMGVLLNVELSQIEQSELNDMVGNLEGSNFIETKKEHMVSRSLIFIIKKLESLYKESGFIPKENSEAFMIAYNFAIKNLQLFEEDRLDQKSKLAMMLSLFLININVDFTFCETFLEENKNTLKDLNIKLIESEINFASFGINKSGITRHEIFPYFYEKNIYLMDPLNIFEIFSSLKIKPYNYVVYRIFKRLACTLHGYTLCNINFNEFGEENNNIINQIENVFKCIEYNETKIEQKYWASFKNLKIFLKLKNFTPKDDLNKENLIFGKNDFLFEDFLKDDLSDNAYIDDLIVNGVFFKFIDQKNLMNFHKHFCEKFEYFLDFINGNVNDITIKNEVYDALMNNKFDPKIKNIERYLDEHNIDEDSDTSFEQLNRAEESNKLTCPKEIEINFSLNLLKQNIYKSRVSKVAECYNYINADMNNENLRYGSSCDNVYRHAVDENVNNPNLRSLVVSAFLRCIYSILTKEEFLYKENNSNKIKIIKQLGYGDILIEKLRKTNTFTKLMLIVDSTKLKESNNSSKILKIIRRIFNGIGKKVKNKDYEIDKLTIITAIIIDKIIEINSDSDSNDSDMDNTLKTLIKCCLSIYREINSKDNLSRRIISSNLIQIIIMKITSFMQKDTQIIENNYENTKFDYNKIYVEVLMLLSEFMKNEKLCYLIIESFNKKIYLRKLKIRKIFVKDLNELSLNMLFASEISKNCENQHDKIIFLSIVHYYNYFFENEFSYNVLILREKYIEIYPYKENFKEFDTKGEEDKKMLKKIVENINNADDNISGKITGVYNNYLILDILTLKCIYYSHFGNRLFLEFLTEINQKIQILHISVLFRKSVEMMFFTKKISIIHPNIIFIECPFIFDDIEKYRLKLREIIKYKEKLEKKKNNEENDDLENNNEVNNIKSSNEDKANKKINGEVGDNNNLQDDLENKIIEFKNKNIMDIEQFKKSFLVKPINTSIKSLEETPLEEVAFKGIIFYF